MDTIKTKLTEKEYIAMNFMLMSKNTGVKIILIITITAFFINTLTGLALYPAVNLLTPLAILIFPSLIILLIYFSAKISFAKKARFTEAIDYTFEQNSLIQKGETFRHEINWKNMHKVSLSKKWLVIWTSKNTGIPIPKQDIWDSEILELKEILNSHKVKNNL